MMTGWIILGIVAWVVLATWPARIASKKGYSFLLFFLLAILISFLLALIVAAMLKDKRVQQPMAVPAE